MDATIEQRREQIATIRGMTGGKEEYRESIKKMIDTALKNTLDEEMRKAVQELMEEQRKAVRQVQDELKTTLRQIVDEEKKSIQERAEELRKSVLKLGL